jgi:putative nucleotidyltransferase with HDIG domain
MDVEMVPSGAFAVYPKQKGLLEAYLGTCVGIALHDPKARVGGLLHLLLPEPTGTDVPYQPETYASTGVPLFLDALCDAGAARDRLEGCLAGGALVGPVSEADLMLDIGGRTSETALGILTRDGVQITQVETGGYFSCKLRLDLTTWEKKIEPMVPSLAGGEYSPVKPSGEQIHEAIRSVRPIPQIALKIIRMIQQEKYGMEDVGREVRQDQVISAKVINLCNTAMIGLRGHVDSIDRALIALGEKRLLQLVVSASVEAMFPESVQGYSLCKGGLFQHAVGSAMIAAELAAYTGRVTPDVAYTAGLLHDIGMIPLDQYVASAAPFFYRAILVEGGEISRIEKDRFGISHTEAGVILGERWELPPNLIDAVKHHHAPEQSEVDRDLTVLVYLSDLLMSRFRVGNGLISLNTDQFVSRLEDVGLGPDQLSVIIDRIPRSVFQVTASL